MDPDVLISVVIPVKNGDSWLNETIPAILNQQVNGAIEIIAIDSGSTDESLSILSKYPVTVVSIKPEDFNHGLTRNKGVSLAKGRFVVMTVQDAKPLIRFGYSSCWTDFWMIPWPVSAGNRLCLIIRIRIRLNGTGQFQSRN